MAVGVRKNV